MVQDRLEQKPDLAVWYMSSLCINDHLEFGASAQSLMTGRVEDDFDALDGTKAFGWLRMFYGRVGRWLPLFRIRREAEGLLFAITGTPEVAHPNRTEDPAEVKAKTFDRFIEVMTKGDGTEAQFEHARQFRLECLSLVVDRFHEMGTKLVIIIGHVHPDVEELYPQMREELLQHVLKAAEGKPTIHVVDEELPACPAEQFRDLAHLGEDYRNAYTEAVFEHLKKTGMVGQATDASESSIEQSVGE